MQLTFTRPSLYTQRMEKTSARWWDLPSAILLFLLVLFSAWRVQVTDWTEGLNLIRNLSIFGLFVGLALGQSKFQKRTVILLSIAYMIVFFIWQWLWFIDFSKEQTYLGEQLLILFGRIFTNINEFFAGREIDDQFFVMALLCFPYWFVGLYSGYQMTRHANVLASVLPAGVLMFIVHNYHYTTKQYGWMFGVYLFLVLLFVSRQKFIKDKIKWVKERVIFSQESGLDITSTTLYLSLAVIAFAWFIPYTLPARAEAREAWKETFGDWFSGERFENMFSSINKEKKPQPRNFQTELSLGTQTSQSDAVIFLVYTTPSAQEFPRLYWRGQIYDYFENNKWSVTSQAESRYNSTGDLEIPDTQNRTRLSFTYDVYTEGQFVLYSASQPISINHNAIILHSTISDENVNEETLDIMALRASPPLEAGDLYRTNALMANPLISELQNAGDDYPDWVKEKYLQLPDDFSPLIRDLALEITAQANTPFNKATAITNYLRSEITYAPAISIPDDVTDPLEYFLLEKKQGFCNYSATAQVLMLRSIGIPARLAVGYAQGEANVQNSIYTVRERDLHAWPEVYFPEYGWIEFEPTGNQAPLTRPEEREERASNINPFVPNRNLPLEEEEQLPLEIEANEEDAEIQPLLTQSQMRWFSLSTGIIVLGLIGFFIKRRYAPDKSMALILKNTFEKWNWKIPDWLNQFLTWANLPSIERNFHAINTSLQWMGISQPIHATAVERAKALQKKLPSANDSIEVLLREHQSALFSSRGGDEKLARRAAWNILTQTISARLKFFFMGYN
ncbi:MAG TPA: hypothetical protein DIW23_05370 [Anaerolineae bacterium]|nr:hypothetical protein [Anaerolineae bacterium]